MKTLLNFSANGAILIPISQVVSYVIPNYTLSITCDKPNPVHSIFNYIYMKVCRYH